MTISSVATRDLTGTWVLDTSASTVSVVSKAFFGAVPVKGSMRLASGTGEVDESGTISGRLVLDAASYDSRMKIRDHHVHSKDFLNVKEHPEIVVDVLSVDLANGELVARVTALGNSTETVVLLRDVSTSPTRVVVEAEVTFDRKDVGMGYTSRGATNTKNLLRVHSEWKR